jgi:bifunctional non-homologous end joining protein LigD
MLAVAGVLPADDDHFGFEFKWDGVRAIAYVDADGDARLFTRNGNEVTNRYPEIDAVGLAPGSEPAVFDGEIVALDESGRPSFSQLQPRMHVSDPRRAQRLSTNDPVHFFVFDVLRLHDRDTMELPYEDRRQLLETLTLDADYWHRPPWYRGGGGDVLRASQEQQLEGVLAKRLSSTYQPGRRSGDWRKVKNLRTQEVVVGGWTEGRGRRSGTMGALLLGLPEASGLRYVGKVGTGFTDAALDSLFQMLRPLIRSSSPFSPLPPPADAVGAQWVTPSLVGEVVFSEWTPEGRLRQPSWRGLRPDKDATDVVPES